MKNGKIIALETMTENELTKKENKDVYLENIKLYFKLLNNVDLRSHSFKTCKRY
jgi:hypothetical protein